MLFSYVLPSIAHSMELRSQPASNTIVTVWPRDSVTHLLQHNFRHPNGVSFRRDVCSFQSLSVALNVSTCAPCTAESSNLPSPRQVPFVLCVPFQKACPKRVYLFYVVKTMVRTTLHCGISHADSSCKIILKI